MSRRTAYLEITVIDDSDSVGWLASATRTGEIYMRDVASMVTEVLNTIGGRLMDRLNILDHGNANGIEIGTDWIDLTTLARFDPVLRRLRGKFSQRGFVHLQHCDVGSNHGLLARLSATFGVPIYAGTGLQNPIYRFNLGRYDRCDPSGTCVPNVGRP
jgi:hypothetical protein